MPRHPLVLRAIAFLGIAGLTISLVMLYVHHQLSVSSGGYTSFCNVSEEINCDAVLGSRYAYFLGIPVAAWTAATYLAFIALTFIPGHLAALAVAALGGVSAGYSAVMAFLSFAVLQTVCLLCVALYFINAALVALAWAHVSRRTRQRTAAAAALGPLVLAAAVGYGAARSTPAPPGLTEAEIAAREPDFYRWYIAQPVVAGTSDARSGPVHSQGVPEATVTIVEFSDFACAHCASAHRALKAILTRHPDDVRLIFRHFPLDPSCNPGISQRVHPTACAAAVASECAGQQHGFWGYHDYLFEHQEPLDYVAVAKQLGLDTERFRACLALGAARERVARDVQRGTELGVRSTPTTYFNGRAIEGALIGPLYEHAVVIEKEHAGPRASTFR